MQKIRKIKEEQQAQAEKQRMEEEALIRQFMARRQKAEEEALARVRLEEEQALARQRMEEEEARRRGSLEEEAMARARLGIREPSEVLAQQQQQRAPSIHSHQTQPVRRVMMEEVQDEDDNDQEYAAQTQHEQAQQRQQELLERRAQAFEARQLAETRRAEEMKSQALAKLARERFREWRASSASALIPIVAADGATEKSTSGIGASSSLVTRVLMLMNRPNCR
jgi:hypothetical protein